MTNGVVLYKPSIILSAINEVEIGYNQYVDNIFRSARLGVYSSEQAHAICQAEQRYTLRFVEKFLLPFRDEAKFGNFLTQRLDATPEQFFGNILEEIQNDLFLREDTKEYLKGVLEAEIHNFLNR